VFDFKRPDITAKAEERKAAALEAKIKAKNEVIAELAEELTVAHRFFIHQDLRLFFLLRQYPLRLQPPDIELALMRYDGRRQCRITGNGDQRTVPRSKKPTADKRQRGSVHLIGFQRIADNAGN
jgi:hypothetical protein